MFSITFERKVWMETSIEKKGTEIDESYVMEDGQKHGKYNAISHRLISMIERKEK